MTFPTLGVIIFSRGLARKQDCQSSDTLERRLHILIAARKLRVR
jgi:hypothetical protein